MELVDLSVLHQIPDSADIESEGVIICRAIDSVSSKGKTATKSVIMTNYYLHVHKKRSMFKKSHGRNKSFALGRLKSISIPDQSSKAFILEFSECKLKFIDDNFLLLVAVILAHLKDFKLPSDMPNINFDPSILPPENQIPKRPQFSANSLMQRRLKFLAATQEKNLPPAFYTTVEKYMNRLKLFDDNDVVFDFRNLMNYPQAFDILLYALIWEESIVSIILPQGKTTNWKFLGQLIASNHSIKEVETMERPDETIKCFVEQIVAHKNNGLINLRFRRASYDQNFVMYLTTLIQNLPKLVEIDIEDSFTPVGLRAFIDNFETCAEYGRISHLSLRENQGIDITRLMSIAPNIRSLELCGCGLEIAYALKEIKNCHLETINLSENKAVLELSPDVILPSTLTKILVSNVSWTQNNFLNFMKIVSSAQMHTRSAFYLDISQINAVDCDNKVAIEGLKFINSSNISSLILNGNQINNEVLSFISNCPSLRSLSVTDCFTTLTLNFKAFLMMIKDNTTITELIIRSTQEPYSQQMTKMLFDFLKSNKSITTFDYQDQHQGAHLYELLKELIDVNPNIREIKFDNNSMTSINDLEGIISAVEKKPYPIKLHIPKRDILDLMSTTPEETLNKQIQILKKLNKGPSSQSSPAHLSTENSISAQQSSSTLPTNTSTGVSLPDNTALKNIENLAHQANIMKKSDSTDLFDFSKVKDCFINDEKWCDSLFCIPVRNTEPFITNINNDLSIERLISLVSTQ